MKFSATWDWRMWLFGVCWSNSDRRRLYLHVLCLEVVIAGRENPAWFARVRELQGEKT